MKKIVFFAVLYLVTFQLVIPYKSAAQFSINGQVRTRTEWRNGVGTLQSTDAKNAFFTSQRSRLGLSYKIPRVTFALTAQDVRVWGQDASTISNADGARFGLHEAWAEVALLNKADSTISNSKVDYLAVKIGRQELNYDDARLLGNLDWLQQARRHDAIVFKLLHKGWQVDAGAAFNQNTDGFNYNGTYYTPANVQPYIKDSRGNLIATPAGLVPLVGTTGSSIKSGTPSLQNMPSTNGLNQNYKALQFLYVAKAIKRTKLSGLLVVDEFGKYTLDSVRTIAGSDTGYVFGRRYNQAGVHGRYTAGATIHSFLDAGKKTSIMASAYYQGGADRDGADLAAYMTTVAFNYATKKIVYTAGWDVLSGNDAFSSSSVNHRFDPLYGTPHKYYGYMDYFYVGTGSPAGGLSNFYLKTKYTGTSKRFSAGIDYHYFALAAPQKDNKGEALHNYLGSEVDVTASYALNKITTLEGGYSFLAATNSMEYAKGKVPGSSNKWASWAWLQLNIRPDFFSK